MAVEFKKIKWGNDKNHAWIDGRQYISLERCLEMKTEAIEEYIENVRMVDALAEENLHLRALLKEQLNNEEGKH